MKRFFALLVATLVATSAFAKFGLTGGVSFSPNQVDFKNIQQWHAGVTWEIPVGIGFALQPSLLYVSKAGLVKDSDQSIVQQLGMGYVQLPVQLLWGPDIGGGNFKPYVFGEPFVGYNLTQNGNWVDVKKVKDVGKLFDWGVGLGVGIKLFKHLQITGKYIWSFGNILNTDGSVNEGYKNFNIQSPGGIQISAAILF